MPGCKLGIEHALYNCIRLRVEQLGFAVAQHWLSSLLPSRSDDHIGIGGHVLSASAARFILVLFLLTLVCITLDLS
jgi:hypothetical protein